MNMLFEITNERTNGKELEDLVFELRTEGEYFYVVEFFKVDDNSDNYKIIVHKVNHRDLSIGTPIARAYVDSDLGSMSSYELNVENNEELTKAILDKIAERIRVAYIQECLATNELSEISLNGYRYVINHAYNFVLDWVEDEETIIEAYLLDRETMCVSEYDFSKEDLLKAKTIKFYKSEEI